MDWAAWWAVGAYVGAVALPIVMLFIVPRGRKPSSAIAWLLVIAILPWVGLALFLILGHPRLPRQRRKRLEETQALVRDSLQETLEDPDAPWIGVDLEDQQAGIATMVERLGAMPPVHGNRIELLDDYDGILARIIADVDGARRFVHVQSYIFAHDDATQPLVDALCRAQERGVPVRVLLDHLGSQGFAGHRGLLSRLRRAGVAVSYMLPFQPWRGRFARPDLRNHRKIVVVDGDAGYIGSQNLVEKHYRQDPSYRIRYSYLELVARVRGPIVQELDAVFRGDWFAETGHRLTDRPVAQAAEGRTLAQVLPSGPGHPMESNLRVFNSLLHDARERIVIVNAYFVPDETLMMSLTSAAQRGVDVVFITPAHGNQWLLNLAQRSFYTELLQAGVRVFLHPRPWNLHTKTMSIDGETCIIGSSNLDIRSFHLNLEVSLICYDAQTVEELRRIEDGYLAQCQELTAADWAKVLLWRHAIQNVARLTSALQ